MIRRITLKNYMAHVDTTLELAEGLNVLVGPNNCGKSAVVSALHLLATLPTREGDYMMRHGTSDCAVTVETAEGDVLCWKRGKGAPKLVINGEEFVRLANDQDHMLTRLHKHLRMPQVTGDARGESFDVHFAMQKDPIFLLGKESQAATFFASSSDASRLLEMQARFKEKVRKKKQENSAQQHERMRLGGELQRLAPLDVIAPELKKLHSEAEALRVATQQAEKLEADLRGLQEAAADCHRVRGECAALEPLQEPSIPTSIAALELLLEGIQLRRTEQMHHAAEEDALAPLQPVPALTDEKPLRVLAEQLHETQQAAAELRAEAATLLPLSEPPEMRKVDELEECVAELRESDRHVFRTRRECELLASIPPLPELVDEEPAGVMREELMAYEKELENHRRECRKATAEFDHYVATNPQCPHCGGVLQAAEAHDHA